MLSSCLITSLFLTACGGPDSDPQEVQKADTWEPLSLTAHQLIDGDPYIAESEPASLYYRPQSQQTGTAAATPSSASTLDMIPDSLDRLAQSPETNARDLLPLTTLAHNDAAPTLSDEIDDFATKHPRPRPVTFGKIVPRVVPADRDYRMNDPEFARLYGPGVFNQTALANTVVGSPRNLELMVSNRFMAMNNGRLSGVRLYWQSGSGYAGGTGGKIELSLYPDDGSDKNLPDMSAAPLATGIYVPGLNPGEKKSLFPLIPMTHSGKAIESGKLYHLVLKNIDPDPVTNFISSNNAITYPATGRPARWLNTVDWSTLLAQRHRGTKIPFTWSNLTFQGTSGNYFSPILQLHMTDGRSQGVGDMEGGSVDNKLIFTSTQSSPVRERFTPSSDKSISGLSFTTAASVAGKLRWSIRQGNTELISGTIEADKPNYQVITTNIGLKMGMVHWYDIAFPDDKNIRMQAGQTYDVLFQPEGNSQWKFTNHRNGSSYGYTWPAAFTESQAQHLYNGSWLNVYHWDYSKSRNGSNWPVVLHLAP